MIALQHWVERDLVLISLITAVPVCSAVPAGIGVSRGWGWGEDWGGDGMGMGWRWGCDGDKDGAVAVMEMGMWWG